MTKQIKISIINILACIFFIPCLTITLDSLRIFFTSKQWWHDGQFLDVLSLNWWYAIAPPLSHIENFNIETKFWIVVILLFIYLMIIFPHAITIFILQVRKSKYANAQEQFHDILHIPIFVSWIILIIIQIIGDSCL